MFVMYNIDVNSQTAVFFRRFAEVSLEDGLENAVEGHITGKETDGKKEESKELKRDTY